MKNFPQKILVSILIILVSFNYSRSQFAVDSKDLIGVWQERDTTLSAGWQARYQFFSDGTFTFNMSQYDWLNPIRSIHGH